MKLGVLLMVIGLGAGFESFAQDSTRLDKEFANPGVNLMGPSKGLILRYERQFDYKFNSTGKEDGIPDQNAQINKSNIAEIKAYIPVWLRPHFKVVFGVSYAREEFNFEDHKEIKEYAYHNNLEEKGLKSLASQLVFLRPVDERHYFLIRVKGELNGDYTSKEFGLKDYFKSSAEAIYGWKKTPDFSWGIGVQLGYTFGRQSIYPAILYNRTFNNRWGLEALFPAKARMRYNQSQSSLWFVGYNVEGSSYNLKMTDPVIISNKDGVTQELRNIELRHNDLKAYLRWEREVLRFLWIGAEGGFRYNVAYDAFRQGSKNTERLISSNVNGAPYAAFEIFLVPPRKILKP